MTNNEFLKYKNVAYKVIKLLYKENLASIRDIELIYNIIRGYPYCIDCEGHYTYNGQYYHSLCELPIDALKQMIGYRNLE